MLSLRFFNIFLLCALVIFLVVSFGSWGWFSSASNTLSRAQNYYSSPPTSDSSSVSHYHAPTRDPPLPIPVAKLYDQVWSEDPTDLEFTALSALCARTTFDPDVYLRCAPAFAGLTTIMSQVKVCIRMAIETGSNLVMQSMTVRDKDDIKELNIMNTDAIHPYDEWFEEATLIERLTTACPNMKVAKVDEQKQPILKNAKSVELDLAKMPYFNGIGNYAWPGQEWTIWFNAEVASLRAWAELENGGPIGPMIVKTRAPLSFFNVMTDISGQSLAVWNELNYLIRFKPVPRKIVNKLIDSLTDQDTGTLIPYYGIHFRTEKDSPDVWTKADEQIKRILETAEAAWTAYEHPPDRKRIIYLACGDSERIAQFEAAASEQGWLVFDKYRMAAMIDSELAVHLSSMQFDHQGMIDLGVMLLSHFFIGLTNSAFSFSTAHSRDPRGRYAGSSLTYSYDQGTKTAASHLFNDGDGAYPCCL